MNPAVMGAIVGAMVIRAVAARASLVSRQKDGWYSAVPSGTSSSSTPQTRSRWVAPSGWDSTR